jgi:cardiolipin synthase
MDSAFWESIWSIGLAWLLLLVQIAGFVLAGRVIMGDRSTHGTIAWAVSLILLPLVAVPGYVLFGRNRLGSYIKSRRRVDDEFNRRQQVEALQPEGSVAGEDETFTQWKILEDLTKVPLSKGNSMDFLFAGRETFDSLLEGIERATEYILFQFFIFRNDSEGKRFTEALKRKARSGVRVYFLVDAIGSRQLSRLFYKDLEDAGVQTGIFLPGRTLRGRLRLNFRNHRKVVLVDGREAWIGGNNIGLEYVGQHPKFGHWRDTHVHVRGPVVNAIQLAFLEDWWWVTRNMPELNWRAAEPQPANVRALCLATGPADLEDNCTLAHVHMINQARHRLWIHSPYFVPSEEVIIALQLAAMRGVDVRILLPGIFDKWLVWISSFYFSSSQRLRKVRFYRYRNGFFHSKMLLVDDELVSVGTVNFDNRSFRINFEMTLVLEDRGLADECRVQMEKDFEEAVEDPDDPLASKSFIFRLGAHTVRLLAPLL